MKKLLSTLFWPKNPILKILNIVFCTLYILGFYPPLTEVIIKAGDYLLLSISLSALFFFYLFLILRKRPQRNVASQATTSALMIIWLFSALYFQLNNTETLFFGLITKSTWLVLVVAFFLTSIVESILVHSEMNSLERIMPDEADKFNEITVYPLIAISFSRLILFFSIASIPVFGIKSLLEKSFEPLINITFFIPFVIALLILLVKKTETAFWALIFLLLATLGVIYFLDVSSYMLGLCFAIFYLFLFTGISIVYDIRKANESKALFLVTLLPIPFLIGILLFEVIRFDILKDLGIYLIVPVISSLVGAAFANYLVRQKEDSMEDIISVKEACKILNMNSKDVYDLLNSKIIPGKKIGNKWFISLKGVNKFKSLKD